jgi:hypothetical protein
MTYIENICRNLNVSTAVLKQFAVVKNRSTDKWHKKLSDNSNVKTTYDGQSSDEDLDTLVTNTAHYGYGDDDENPVQQEIEYVEAAKLVQEINKENQQNLALFEAAQYVNEERNTLNRIFGEVDPFLIEIGNDAITVGKNIQYSPTGITSIHTGSPDSVGLMKNICNFITNKTPVLENKQDLVSERIQRDTRILLFTKTMERFIIDKKYEEAYNYFCLDKPSDNDADRLTRQTAKIMNAKQRIGIHVLMDKMVKSKEGIFFVFIIIINIILTVFFV